MPLVLIEKLVFNPVVFLFLFQKQLFVFLKECLGGSVPL